MYIASVFGFALLLKEDEEQEQEKEKNDEEQLNIHKVSPMGMMC